MSVEFYPWLHEIWQSMWSRVQQDRFPHALLLQGIEGLGKNALAMLFAQSLFCENRIENNKPCGMCGACYLMQAKNFPDFLSVFPEKVGKMIKIEQIRQVNEFVSKTSQMTAMSLPIQKIVIISPAEAMNVASANALLKSLEEPPSKTLFILVSDNAYQIPATILSRCQRLVVGKVDESLALPWLKSQISASTDPALLLKLSEGAPLRAQLLADTSLMEERKNILSCFLESKTNPVVVSASLQKIGLAQVTSYAYSLATDFMCVLGGCQRIVNEDYHDACFYHKDKINRQRLLHFFDKLIEVRRALSAKIALNGQLMIEDLLIDWQAIFTRS
jgi:DNA polymerase-3 subunit delta'